MNRRGFFALLGAAAATPLIAEIELFVPKRTIFLPPRNGWFVSKLPMREMRAYDIRNDLMYFRYDAAWQINGEVEQHSVDIPLEVNDLLAGKEADSREIARRLLKEVEDRYGVSHKRIVLPENEFYKSSYV